MVRTNYQRGYETERKIIEQLADQGYLVLRSAGSHSKIDVLGIKRNRIVAIQSKRTKKFSMSSYRAEIKAIQEIIEQYGLEYIVDFEFWVWVDRQGFRKWEVFKDEVKEIVAN